MIPSLETYSYSVALGALFLQLVTVYLLIEHFFLTEKYLAPYARRFGVEIVFTVGIVSAAFSLIYSEVYGFIPCGLCWVERGILYSLIVFSGTALWKSLGNSRLVARAVEIADYGIVLSVIAGAISLYHHYGQMTGGGLICPTAGVGSDCARRLVFEFGYITLPLMSFTAFAFFTVVFWVYRRER